jgi:RHS repeat-associated protein
MPVLSLQIAQYYIRGAYGELLAQYDGLSHQYWNIRRRVDTVSTPEGETIGRMEASPPESKDDILDGTFTAYDRYYYLKDHLGSIRVTLKDNGSVVGYDDYYPFGLQLPGRSSNTDNTHADQITCPDASGYTGHFLESEGNLGLYHAQARLYDPEVPRFYGVDAMRGNMPGWNPYHYTFNNPVRFVDPDGNMPSCPNCNPVNRAWRTAEGMWNTAVSYISNAPANAAQEMKNTSVNVIQNGPEALDYLTVGSTGVAVASAGIAVGTGPEPVSTGSAGAVAGLAATTAAVSDATATGLSLIDAFVLDGDKSEAFIRAIATVGGFSAGRASVRIAGSALAKHNPKNLTTSQKEALSKGAGAVTSGVVGTGAQNSATPTPSNEPPEQKRTPEER